MHVSVSGEGVSKGCCNLLCMTIDLISLHIVENGLPGVEVHRKTVNLNLKSLATLRATSDHIMGKFRVRNVNDSEDSAL
jgi:hypothetical protein